MPDVFNPEQRSAVMRRVQSKNTKPELALRRALHAAGFRYRLHVNDLPGKPDIVLPRYDAVIQVRGCFWHGHSCVNGTAPASRQEYWLPKLAANKARDQRNDRLLRKLGWRVISVWECQLKGSLRIEQQLRRILRLIQNLS